MTSKFTVIRGGMEAPSRDNSRIYRHGFITDTRLMGVVGMELTWEVQVNSKIETLNQIFYLDSEEFGFESYIEAYGDNPEEIIAERKRFLGALGGNSVPITEKEACFLLQSCLLINKKYKQELPTESAKWNFMTKNTVVLNLEEYNTLMEKMCGILKSPYFSINYYLMRSVSDDVQGIAHLTADTHFEDPEHINPGQLPEFHHSELRSIGKPSTLCKNTVELHGAPEDHTYLCESLVEYNDKYRLMTSEIALDPNTLLIKNARKCSDFKITSAEAAMLMNRSEYISVYEVLIDLAEFEENFKKYASAYTETPYENGKLFIDFNETNDHVGKHVYRINDDIHAMYYLTDFGQLLVMGYDVGTVQDAEMHMGISLPPYCLIVSVKYEFKEPVLYEFIRSDFEDFDDFLAFISGNEE